MKRITFLAILISLLLTPDIQAQTNLLKGDFNPQLTGTEVVFAELTINATGTDVNTVFGLAPNDKTTTTWGDYAAGINFNANSFEIKPRNGGSNIGTGVFAIPGKKFRVWFALNVAAKTYSFKADGFDANGLRSEATVNDYGFRVTSGTAIAYYYASSDKPHNQFTVHMIKTVPSIGSFPAEYASNANLNNIKLSVGNLTFNPATTTYNINLPKGTKSVDVEAITEVGLSTVIGAGTIDVSSGHATTKVQVISQDDTNESPEYTLNFNVLNESTDASLSSIKLDGVALAGFNPNVLNYTLYFNPSTTAVPVVTAVKNNEFAKEPVITPASAIPGTASIKVVAESGAEQTYTIRFAITYTYGWDANGATGVGSAPNNNGWSFSGNVVFNDANVAGGVRYMDHGNGEFSNYKFEGNDYTKRLLWVRWSSTDAYRYSVANLEPCQVYKFSFKHAWHNNASAPILTVGIHSKPDSTLIKSADFAVSSTKRELKQGDFYFIAPAGGQVYFSIRSSVIAGDVLIALSDISIVKADGMAPEFALQKNRILITNYTQPADKQFAFSALALQNDVTVTAPAGISLTYGAQNAQSISIPKDVFDCGSRVTVGLNVTANENIADSIVLSSGSGENRITKKLAVYNFAYSGYNKIPFALGLGTTDAGKQLTGESTDPATFGWQGISNSAETPKYAQFGNANSTGGIRYLNVTNMKYCAEFNDLTDVPEAQRNFVPWNDNGNGWMLYLRWDGGGNTDSLTVFSYPVDLVAGKKYNLKGKYAWINNGSESYLKFGVNTKRDNSGTMLASTPFFEYLSLATYQNLLMEIRADQYEGGTVSFTPSVSGTYYLTVFQDPDWATVKTQILLGLADLVIHVDGESSVIIPATDDVKIIIENCQIRVTGADDFKVYSLTGASLNAKTQLSSGIYIVSVNGKQYKVIVK